MNTPIPIIEVKNISKTYKINHESGGYLTLRDILADTLRHPLKFLKRKLVGASDTATGKKSKEIFWALRDVSFSVYPGEVVGIIGANGSGKSTLLKILSKITPPSEGEIIVRGNMASLLEVGTGFHPELTGRENIALNGAILGMSRKEIADKFEEIVSFSGVGQFLDTPVKYYSSGMYVRLAFAVAAHMEPDILVVDEVLAVGDAEFQKKSLGKMEEVTKSAGRTILFVSHNMSAILNLCKRSVLLEKGQVKMVGLTRDVVNYYLNLDGSSQEKKREATTEFPADQNKSTCIRKITVVNSRSEASPEIQISEKFFVDIEFDVNREASEVLTSLILFAPGGQRVLDIVDYQNTKRPVGSYKSRIEFPDMLNANSYSLMVVVEKGNDTFDKRESSQFRIVDTEARSYDISGKALLMPKLKWNTEKL